MWNNQEGPTTESRLSQYEPWVDRPRTQKRDTVPKDKENTGVMKQILGFGIRQIWVSPTSSLTSCVTLGNTLNFSEPQFSHFKKWEQNLPCIVAVQIKSDRVWEGHCRASNRSSAHRLRTGYRR